MLNDPYSSSLDVYTWNAMNEPSIFNEKKVTIPEDCLQCSDMNIATTATVYASGMF